jgi:hypothetical protein
MPVIKFEREVFCNILRAFGVPMKLVRLIKMCLCDTYSIICNILREFGVPMKLVRLIKMCLCDTYSIIWIGKHLSDSYPIVNGLKPDDLSQLLSTLLQNIPLGSSKQIRRD